MNRILADYDWCPYHNEAHIPCAGGSIGVPRVFALVNPLGALGSWKVNPNVQMGSTACLPLGLGHDGGPGRVHVLVCPGIDPASIASASAIASALATLSASVKPLFSAHKVQLNVGGQSLPVCTDPTPTVVGWLCVLFCGLPPAPNTIPLIPSQTTVFTTMTNGDYVGGVVNYFVEQYWALANLPSAFIPADDLSTVLRVALNILPVLGRFGDILGDVKLGPSNIGVLAQVLVDRDNVHHDADPGFAVGLMGTFEIDLDAGPDYSNPLSSLFGSSNSESAESQSESPWERMARNYGREGRMWR